MLFVRSRRILVVWMAYTIVYFVVLLFIKLEFKISKNGLSPNGDASFIKFFNPDLDPDLEKVL